MVSYADFVTLLFCFFTAMYAISNVDTSKLGKFVNSMRSAFNVDNARGNALSVIEGVQVFIPSDVDVESNVREILGTMVKESQGAIDVRRDRRGVVISVADKYFFSTGSAVLTEKSAQLLDAIAETLKQNDSMVRIEGHTDNIPIHNNSFPSNWELSSSRAINVAKYFIGNHNISPERLSTTGYAEFRPVASNDTPAGRAKNRRVDIVIMNAIEQGREPS